jgi:hypothetical protein
MAIQIKNLKVSISRKINPDVRRTNSGFWIYEGIYGELSFNPEKIRVIEFITDYINSLQFGGGKINDSLSHQFFKTRLNH